jgi:hypothetical protein
MMLRQDLLSIYERSSRFVISLNPSSVFAKGSSSIACQEILILTILDRVLLMY